MLEAAGIAVPAKAPRLLIGIVNADDPWVTSEQLMPMLPVVKVSDFDSALALALKVEEGLHHTAIMHSQNVSRLNLAARTLQTSIFVKNGPLMPGSASAVKALPPSLLPRQPVKEQHRRALCTLRRCVLTNGFSIR
jgi:propionaldehyde dehydrogenase